MPFPFLSSLFVTMILIFGILYEPAPKNDFLDLLPKKNSFLKGASQLAKGFTDKKVGKQKNSEKIIKDQVPIVAAANKKGEGGANKFFDEEEQYEVVGGDTLMLIAFKLFGDYHFWKELAMWNKEFLGKSHGLDIGMNLKFFKIKRENSWPPEGNPYMIKKGDFLTKISEKIYGTSRKWRKIFKRNKLMIKNPNLIFAGFTLFYDSRALKL